MERIFWATCRQCRKAFSVDWAIRHADVELECPYCRNKFKADDAAALDERWG